MNAETEGLNIDMTGKKYLLVTEDGDGKLAFYQVGGMVWAVGAAETAQRLLTLKLLNLNKVPVNEPAHACKPAKEKP